MRYRWKDGVHTEVETSAKQRRSQIYNPAMGRAKGVVGQMQAMRADLPFQSEETQRLLETIQKLGYALAESIRQDQKTLIRQGH